MPLGRRNPFEGIEELLKRMGEQLEAENWPSAEQIDVDVAEHEDRYVVEANLPGYDQSAVDVHLVAGSLHLEADRELDEDEDIDYLHRERLREQVSRRLSLPEPVDETEVSATYADGVLTVELPKQGSDAGTSIEID